MAAAAPSARRRPLSLSIARFILAVALAGGALAPLAGCRRAHDLACGPTLHCDPGTTYCEIIKTDVPRLPSDYHCRSLPAGCRSTGANPAAPSKPGCACFPAGTRCNFCSVVELEGGGNGFRRTCVGGA